MKIAVGFVHGIGKQKSDFYEGMAAALSERLAEACPEIQLMAEGIYWADLTDRLEDKLKERLAPYDLRWDNWIDARGYVISFLGDAIAYQPLNREDDSQAKEYIYADIHERFFDRLESLSRKAGPNAPLCLIAHSLGTIITSNYLYDLQNGILPPRIRGRIADSDSALVRGETLTHLYTMGSPIAVWTMRYEDFGQPIAFPSPLIRERGLPYGEWVNFYDKDDVIAYPIKPLSHRYCEAVTADIEVRNPGILANTPLGAHGGYYRSEDVLSRIVNSLVDYYYRTTTNQEIAAAKHRKEM